MSKIVIEESEFKGQPVITIWETDDEGKKKQFPVISFGKKKAKILVDNIKEIQDFASKE